MRLFLYILALIYGVCLAPLWADEAAEAGGVNEIEEVSAEFDSGISSSLSDKEYQDLLIEQEINRTLSIRDGMLKAHEILGWATVGLLTVNTLLTTPGPYDQDVHTAVGITAGSLYLTTAALSFFTPRLHEGIVFGGDKESKSKFIHKLLAFIHFPAMVSTIVLGILVHRADEGEINISPQSRAAMRKAHTATSLITLSSLTMSLVVVYLD